MHPNPLAYFTGDLKKFDQLNMRFIIDEKIFEYFRIMINHTCLNIFSQEKRTKMFLEQRINLFSGFRTFSRSVNRLISYFDHRMN